MGPFAVSDLAFVSDCQVDDGEEGLPRLAISPIAVICALAIPHRAEVLLGLVVGLGLVGAEVARCT